MPDVHRHPHRVTYAECTIGNHVYYARYLDLLEEARGAFFRSIGHPLLALEEQDVILPVVECHVRYLAPARYDDELVIETWVTDLGRVRVAFGHRIFNAAGEVLLEATTEHACAYRTQKLRRVPEDLRRLLDAARKEPPTHARTNDLAPGASP